VMLYGRRLPLYVVALYPMFIYTAWAAVHRLGLPRAVEPFVVGLAIVLIDVPFDVLGPPVGWWTWSSADPNLRVRWLGVPVTSYYWHLTFGGALVFLARSVAPLVRRGRAYLLLAPLVGAATLIVGTLAFLPFHGLRALGVPDGANLALLAAVAAGLLLGSRPRASAPPDRALLAIPVLYHLFFLAVLVWARLSLASTAVIAAATALSLALHAYAQARRPA
jgi:hypothetical protein